MEESHDNWDSEDGQAEEQVTIWGVRRKLLAAYFWLFSLLFAGVSGVAVWLEWAKAAPGTDAATILMAAMGEASGRVIWLAAFSFITVEVGNVIAEYFIVNRYNRGLAKGRQEGMERHHQEWQAWYERQQAALRDGRPFNEPPPGVPQNKNGK